MVGGKTGESDDLALLRSVGGRLGEAGGMQEFLDVLLGDSGRAVSTFELLNSKTMAKLVAYLTGGCLPVMLARSTHMLQSEAYLCTNKTLFRHLRM